MRINDRIPVIPLSYELRELAVERELIVNPATGEIFVVGTEKAPPGTPEGEITGGGNLIYNITDAIADILLNHGIDSGKLVIEIEGLGLIDLQSILNQLYLRQIELKIKGSGIAVSKDLTLDNISLVAKDNVVQIKGFDTAEGGTLLRKGDTGNIEWVHYTGSGGGSTAGGGCNGVSHSEVFILDPDADNVYKLISSKPQASGKFTTPKTVEMPNVETTYCKIIWKLTTGVNPKVTFPNNITWQYENEEIVTANSTHIFEFETWDRGVSWFGKNNRYGIKADDDLVTVGYLESNVYYKDETDEKLAWRFDPNITDEYVSKSSLYDLIKPEEDIEEGTF